MDDRAVRAALERYWDASDLSDFAVALKRVELMR
jgi:hypothetical protein